MFDRLAVRLHLEQAPKKTLGQVKQVESIKFGDMGPTQLLEMRPSQK